MGSRPGRLSRTELGRLVEGVDAIVALHIDPIDISALEVAGAGLKIVANVAVGYDNIDLHEASRRGVVVSNTPSVLTDATADLAIALILAVTRRLGEGERLLRSGSKWSWSLDFMLGHSLQGKTLGVIGMGEIGRATALRAKAFGMRIAHHNRTRAAPASDDELEAEWLSFEDLLERADVVTLHCPLNDSTRHLIDATALSRMKQTAYLINTARGPVVDEAALVKALSDGTIAGAALDVYENEPELEPNLRRLENVILIPHLGTATVETRERMAVLAVRNVLEVLAGKPALTAVVG